MNEITSCAKEMFNTNDARNFINEFVRNDNCFNTNQFVQNNNYSNTNEFVHDDDYFFTKYFQYKSRQYDFNKTFKSIN